MQEFVWWTTSALTVLLVCEKVWGWATYRRKQRVFVEVVAPGVGGGTDNRTLKVSSFAVRFDKRRNTCVIPGHGILHLDRARVQQARHDRRGFTVRNAKAVGDVEESYVLVAEWPL